MICVKVLQLNVKITLGDGGMPVRTLFYGNEQLHGCYNIMKLCMCVGPVHHYIGMLADG